MEPRSAEFPRPPYVAHDTAGDPGTCVWVLCVGTCLWRTWPIRGAVAASHVRARGAAESRAGGSRVERLGL